LDDGIADTLVPLDLVSDAHASTSINALGYKNLRRRRRQREAGSGCFGLNGKAKWIHVRDKETIAFAADAEAQLSRISQSVAAVAAPATLT
jgi:hypothetical protein